MRAVHFRRALLAVLIALAGCSGDCVGGESSAAVAPNAPADSLQRVSAPGKYAGYTEKKYSEYVLESRYVEMRDGTKLAVDIFRPATNGEAVEGRFPLVWMHTPYSRARITPDGDRASILASGDFGFMHLLDYGYVVAAVDTRGRGASFGVRRGFLDRTEAEDAYEMTEWFAAQAWSDGNIGLAGCSYNGSSTLHAATVAPPHLKAIAPGCFAFDSYRFVARGGIPAQFNTRPEDPQIDYGFGVAPVDEDTNGSMAAAAIEMHYGGTPMAELWRGMPHRDDISPILGTDFWRETSPASYIETIEKSGVGVFMWGNWRDEGVLQQLLALSNLNNPRKLWVGGWGHCEVGDFPMQTELLRFFDYYLKGIDNGWEDEAPIVYYTINAVAGEEWTFAESWPPAHARGVDLFLAGVASTGTPGQLETTQPLTAAKVGTFKVDYAPECADMNLDLRFLFNPCVVDNVGVSFETPVLATDLHLLGHPIVDLQISASTEDADMFAYLEAVSEDGSVSIVTHGRLRLSHNREQVPALDYLGVPYHGGRRADVATVEPGIVVQLRFDLLPTSIVIEAGTRLRLTLAGADPRQRFRTIEFDPPPLITVQHLDARASRLTLPVASAPVYVTAQ
jgi:putative CocE/NonD family hydrolase